MEKTKICVAEYLKFLNEEVKHCITYHNIKKDDVKTINCKELAELCNVTPATISNLNTDSKYSLIDRIAEEILDCYYSYFEYNERKAKIENPDEIIYPRDKNYIIMYLTNYYTEQWLHPFN